MPAETVITPAPIHGTPTRHFGCPDCGNVRKLPHRPGEPAPWCIHTSGDYSWRAPDPATQAGPHPWTQMLPVTVTVQADAEPPTEQAGDTELYATTYTATILSERPLHDMDLADALREADTGDFVADIEASAPRRLTVQQMAAALTAAGSGAAV